MSGLRDLLDGPHLPDLDAVALSDGERSWTYRELGREAEELAGRLADVSAGRPSPVAVVLPPSADAIVALHAVLASGRLLAPVDPKLTDAEVDEALEAVRPGAVVRGGPRGVVVEPGFAPRAPSEEGDVAAVLWTSGTSGRRRGVLISARALRASAEGSRARLHLGRADRWYASLSIAHVGGLALVTRAALLGCRLVARGAFDAADLAERVDAGEVTHASLVPTMLSRFLDARGDRPPPPSFRLALIGGAPCAPRLLERALEAGVPVALTYGMTEATSQVATAPPELVRRKPGTVGPPLDGVEVRTENGGRAGEIFVRGETLSPGLLSGEPVAGTDGWYATGDLGFLDPDGHLHVTGRMSDRIVTGGVNVDPHEVEAALRELEGVADAVVVGVDDPEWGEVVCAALVPSAGPHPAAGVDPDEVRRRIRTRLSGAKTPKRYLVVDALPLNPHGKVDRGALRSAFLRA